MISLALLSAFAAYPQATHRNTSCRDLIIGVCGIPASYAQEYILQGPSKLILLRSILPRFMAAACAGLRCVRCRNFDGCRESHPFCFVGQRRLQLGELALG